MWKKYKPYIISIIIPLIIGGLAGIITMNSMDIYNSLIQPPLSPPGYIFPIVWTILFILMGISSGIIYTSNDENKKSALIIYAVQLAVNFLWSVFFFGIHAKEIGRASCRERV